MLHSAGHLLDVCMRNVGLGHLEPGKGYRFPDGFMPQYYHMKKLLSCVVVLFLITFPSNPRIIKLGDNPGCPCGGTHVLDISEIIIGSGWEY
ncbi:hypothetical protein CRYUN_Cryun10bG0017100 [Craigia yunnanensis]